MFIEVWDYCCLVCFAHLFSQVIKTVHQIHENISPAFRAGDMFFIKYGEIRMWIEGPGGAFIDQFKNWSIL